MCVFSLIFIPFHLLEHMSTYTSLATSLAALKIGKDFRRLPSFASRSRFSPIIKGEPTRRSAILSKFKTTEHRINELIRQHCITACKEELSIQKGIIDTAISTAEAQLSKSDRRRFQSQMACLFQRQQRHLFNYESSYKSRLRHQVDEAKRQRKNQPYSSV